MKKTIKAIGTVSAMGIMLLSSYWLGTAQAKPVTEIQTVKEVQTITKEVIPEDYIPLSECIPLQDIACYFIDGYDYPCFELSDVGNQLDNSENRSYKEIMEGLKDETRDFKNNFIDVRTVIDYKNTDYGLQLYCADGSKYFVESRED